jgi:hypothetical protein
MLGIAFFEGVDVQERCNLLTSVTLKAAEVPINNYHKFPKLVNQFRLGRLILILQLE